MEIKVKKGDPRKQKTPCLVLGALEGRLNTPLLKDIDAALDGALSRAVREQEFSGKTKEVLLLHPGRRLPAERVLVVGLGKEKKNGLERLRQTAGTAASFLQGKKIVSFAVDLASLPLRGTEVPGAVQALIEGIVLATYRFDRYRTENRGELAPELAGVTLLTEKQAQVRQAEAGIAAADAVCRGVVLARDLVNQPGNAKAPEYLAEQARKIAEENGLQCTVLERADLEREGLGALLGVAQGSVREPRLIVLEYRGGSS